MPINIEQYFEAINQKKFEQTAALFGEQGELVPPFEKAIVGRAAIAQYIEKETLEMTLIPEQILSDEWVDGVRRIVIEGKVKHPLFGVGVVWEFDLNDSDNIIKLKGKLLASLKTLMGISR